MLDYLEFGLRLLSKITNKHISLTSFSVMNIFLAAKVLSTSASIILKNLAQPETTSTAKDCEMFDKFFDCMNVVNTQ